MNRLFFHRTQHGRHAPSFPRPRPSLALQLIVLGLAPMAGGTAVAQIAFADVSGSAGVTRAGESYGASWGDLDGDGYPDLFISNHRQQPGMYLNMRNGKFFQTAAQVLTWRNRPKADTHGASWADFDNDGDQDLLVSAGTGNLSQLLVNESARLVDRTTQRGLTTTNLGGRLPVWFDYDGDKLIDFAMTQYGGVTKVYRQGPLGHFTETTTDVKSLCTRHHYGQLLDVTNDGNLDFVCSDEASFPQKIYNVQPFPWQKVYDKASPAGFLPAVRTTVDSVLADFDNDGRQDLFVLGGGQLRPAAVVPGSSTHFESQLTGGTKGFRFVTSGKVTFKIDWNKQEEESQTDLTRIEIGAGARHPASSTFTLDPADTSVRNMPLPPEVQADIPVMQIGYDAAAKRWTLVLQTKLNSSSPNVFSEAYLVVDSTASISGLTGTGFWTSDSASRPTLLMNRSGGFIDETVRADLDAPVQCVSATAADFDNDMDVDLYLACRTGASNLPNILYENLGGASFRKLAGAGGAVGPVGVAVGSGAGTADSVVSADYNVDGFVDLFVTNGFNLRPLGFGGKNKLFRNKGNGKRWVEVDLVGAQSDRDATGARVYATAGGVTQMRVQNGQYHRWSQDHKRSHFGLGSASSVTLRVEWPSGAVQNFNSVATNRLYRIQESGGLATASLGVAPVYACGAPSIDASNDRAVFLWRDCPTGEWRFKATAGGGVVNYKGSVSSGSAFQYVREVGTTDADKVTWTFGLEAVHVRPRYAQHQPGRHQLHDAGRRERLHPDHRAGGAEDPRRAVPQGGDAPVRPADAEALHLMRRGQR